MSGGETGPTGEIAKRVAKDLLSWFKWEKVDLHDRNFDCKKNEKHSQKTKTQHTHPVDVVFKYHDPYLGRLILLNTDLKSYAKSSIGGPNVRKALKSLAQTIDCARVSPVWKERYDASEQGEVRGLLFVYNHDAEYDESFSKYLAPPKHKEKKVKVTAQIGSEDKDNELGLTAESLPIEAGQMLHIIEPKTIAYMSTILSDIRKLHMDGEFPKKNYSFFYPDLKLHKTHDDKFARPATIEMICGPFLVIEHEAVVNSDPTTGEYVTTFPEGYVIYYNRPGATHFEFMYLFDVLSNMQILDGAKKLRIRVAHGSPHIDINSLYKKAIHMYISDWGFSSFKREVLEGIGFEIIPVQKSSFSMANIGWDRD